MSDVARTALRDSLTAVPTDLLLDELVRRGVMSEAEPLTLCDDGHLWSSRLADEWESCIRCGSERRKADR